MSNICGVCGNYVRDNELYHCGVCEMIMHNDGEESRFDCKRVHDAIVKEHAKLCHIAIDNTFPDSFAGVLCRQCGKEARCDH